MTTTPPAVAPMTGAEFRTMRLAMGYSQAKLAALLGKTDQTIYRWEADAALPVDPTVNLAMRKLYDDARRRK